MISERLARQAMIAEQERRPKWREVAERAAKISPVTENATGLNALWHEWFVRGCKRTFSPFHRRVVTTNALEVGAAGEGDNRDHSFSAFRAERCSIHEDSSRFFHS